MTYERPTHGRTRGWLGTRADKILNWLTDHPVAKLAAFGWMAVISVALPVRTCSRERQEEARRGLHEEPVVRLAMQDRTCLLTNAGVRPIAEATIVLNTYLINLEECGVQIALSGSHLSPASAARELLPRDQLKAEYEAGRLDGWGCKGPTRVVVECDALFHRPEGLEPFARRAYSIASSDCSKLTALTGLYSWRRDDAGEHFIWKDKSDEKTFQCFSRSAAFRDVLRDAEAARRRGAEELVRPRSP